MQFSPSVNECEAMTQMSGTELLEYFVTRSAEVEEIWGLGNDSGWVMREDDIVSLPVWPYRQLAMENASGDWETQVAQAMSLEHFIFKVLKMLIDENIQVEIMPVAGNKGLLVEAGYLFKLFESTIESGEYFLEG